MNRQPDNDPHTDVDPHTDSDLGPAAHIERDAVAALTALFARPAARTRYAESVTQLEHALQCAELASRAAAEDSLVAAALLHDVGHLLTRAEHTARTDRPGARPAEDLRHEIVAARYLSRWFDADVTRPVLLHVVAKRYLCAVDPRYLSILSPGSVHSLNLQGGPMTDAECAAFESTRGWSAAVLLRRWDDQAKHPDAAVAPLDAYGELLAGCSSSSRNTSARSQPLDSSIG